MSFGQKIQGKLIAGSSVHRILFEINSTRLRPDLSGTLTLYERRHEKSKLTFDSLIDFMVKVRQLWSTSSTATIPDIRLARWIEQYFVELNISASYEEILSAVKGEFKEVPPIEVSPPVDLTREQIIEFHPEQEEYITIGKKMNIVGTIVDLKELEEMLDNFIRENLPNRTEFAAYKYIFNIDGSSKEMNGNNPIVDFPLDDESIITSGFLNNFNEDVLDVVVENIIPYDYSIRSINSHPGYEKIKEEKTKYGYAVTWKIAKIEAKQTAIIEYNLAKRMQRTILIRDDEEIIILQLYENINKKGKDIWIESKYNFLSNTPIVENVKIVDQIPGEYSIKSTKPEITKSLGKINKSSYTTEISWSHTDVPANTLFSIEYDLDDQPHLFRDSINIINKSNEVIGEIVKLVKPLNNKMGYGIIIAYRLIKSIDHILQIQDTISSNFQVEIITNEIGKIIESTDNNSKIITWKLENTELNKISRSYLRINGVGKYDLENFTVTNENNSLKIKTGTESTVRVEKIHLPNDFIYQVDPLA
ncbi:MAG: hypothetical protein OEZ01_03220 [Candidatus Heimdallarchaeota archaeon]|nr:hypothetical protein [Candidatus Heimdallarchaeota archaeon]MDH5644988.1 hypothetical protein [Candidatus Heimdallarchaeota archaeon]